MIEAAAARIAFVAFHNGGPLLRGHRAGSRIGQQVNEHGISRKLEQVVAGGPQKSFPLPPGGPVDWFHALDAKGLDDGVGAHGTFPRQQTPAAEEKL